MAKTRLNTGTLFYNACLREVFDRAAAMRADPRWEQAGLMPKTVGGKPNRERKTLYKTVKDAYGFSAYSMDTYATAARVGFLNDHILSQEGQNLARQAFRAVEQWMYGKRGKPRYKSQARGIRSMETKGTTGSIRLHVVTDADGTVGFEVAWGKQWRAPIVVDPTNPVHAHNIAAVQAGMLYGRIVRRVINNRDYYYVQFVCDGVPLQRYATGPADSVVGVDVGVSTVAVVTDTGVFLEEFCTELDARQQERRRLQRHLDRQHRAGSPDCFNPDGTHKHGKCEWKRNRSTKAQETITRLAELDRRQSAHRKSLHGNLSNRILAHGTTVRVESTSKRSWQAVWGRSINFRAPGTAENLLRCKAASAGGRVDSINPYHARLSQSCVCGVLEKKELSQRVHDCACGVVEQRDIWSAFLARHVSVGERIPNLAAARHELQQRHDIGVGRRNSTPNLRLPPATQQAGNAPKVSPRERQSESSRTVPIRVDTTRGETTVRPTTRRRLHPSHV